MSAKVRVIPPSATKAILRRKITKLRRMADKLSAVLIARLTQEKRDDIDFDLDYAIERLELSLKLFPPPPAQGGGQ